jgi:hypothetical protein
MTTTRATSLLMPRALFGTPGIVSPTLQIPGHVGFLPAAAGTGLAQPGPAEGDTNLLQTDPVDDETAGSQEVGLVAVPHFPRGGSGNRNLAHVIGFSTIIRSRYFYGSAAQYQRLFPAPDGDTSSGLPDPMDDEVFSEMASWSEKDGFPRDGQGQAAAEMRKSGLAHQADRGMGEEEQTVTGATGVWAIAGPA